MKCFYDPMKTNKLFLKWLDDNITIFSPIRIYFDYYCGEVCKCRENIYMIIFVWSCKCRHIYEKAMIIQYYFFSPSICVSLVTELNKKKVICQKERLSMFQGRRIIIFLWHKFCKQMCVTQICFL